MSSATASRISAGLGFLAVALGAFGAHGLKPLLVQNGMADVWEKAVFYHFVHAVMLFILAERQFLPKLSWWAFMIGILLFSGSLYLLAVTNVYWLGFVTPVGGVCLLIGWLGLLIRPARNAV